MRSMVWIGPEGDRYNVFLVREPYDSSRQSIVFRREDGSVAVNSIEAWRDLRDIMAAELAELLNGGENIE